MVETAAASTTATGTTTGSTLAEMDIGKELDQMATGHGAETKEDR
jgi:hypothetical protein